MIINLNNFSKKNYPKLKKKYDFVIVGAGAAGITLALELEKSNFTIALCEAGDLTESNGSKNCYKGDVIGDYYMPLDETRLRFLGGSTNHWGGWTYPLDSIDFDRGYIDQKFIWPISKNELSPYLDKACNYLDIENSWGEDNYENPSNQKKSRNLFLHDKDSKINKFDFQFSRNKGAPTRFGRKFLRPLDKSKKIDVFLNANLKEIDGEYKNIRNIFVSNYHSLMFKLSTKNLVFAMGGIENSRFLLWFSKIYGEKYFYKNLPIGKYWMDHPHHTIGMALLHKDIGKKSFFRVNDQLQKKHNIFNFGLRVTDHLSDFYKGPFLFSSLNKSSSKLSNLYLQQYLHGNIRPYLLSGAWEQEPQESNQIILSESKKDKFDIPRVKIYYKKNDRDRETMKKSMLIFSDWIIENGLGRIKFDDWIINNSEYPKAFYQGHHMGGTRMHNSKEFGVIDKNCKVYGSNNLYVIGSSIFTTGGHANPTLSIIQLTLKLADYFKSKYK